MRVLVNDFAGHAFPTALSRSLAKLGHEVLHAYFAGNNSPKGPLSKSETDPAGLSVAPLNIPGEFHKHSLLKRRQADIAYGNAIASLTREWEPEVVISANMPLDAQGRLLSQTHASGARFVFWLQDVYSEAIRFVLHKKGIPLASLAAAYYRRMEKDLLRQSDAVVCIAPEFRSVLKNWGLPLESVHVIENWASLAEIPVVAQDNAWSREQGIAGKFCFVYSGTLGMKHKPELLLALAKEFENNPNVVTVVIAEGAGADWLRKHASQVKESTLKIMTLQPYDRLPETLGSASALIVLLDEDCGGFAVPSKALSYLCAGKPVLLSAPLENHTATIVRAANAGLGVAPKDERGFLEAAQMLYSNAELRERLSGCARKYAEQTFDLNLITAKFLQVFEQAMGRKPEALTQRE